MPKQNVHAHTAPKTPVFNERRGSPPHYVLRRYEVTILDCRPMKLARRVSFEQGIKMAKINRGIWVGVMSCVLAGHCPKFRLVLFAS